ncbi:MAG: hypothetical protein ABI746_10430 [Dermatophilaceae bacterium]
MPSWIFPDNTVLCNFAAIGRADLLHAFLGDRGRWAEAVAAEAQKSADYLPDLFSLIKGAWLGEPIELTDPAHIRRIEVIRRDVFGGRSSEPLKHLGEAQTCFLIREVDEWRGSTWISDDRDALDFAMFQQIPTMETIDIVRWLVASYDITGADGMTLLKAMSDADRALRLPKSPGDLGG